jgi:hypothetical protein
MHDTTYDTPIVARLSAYNMFRIVTLFAWLAYSAPLTKKGGRDQSFTLAKMDQSRRKI